MHPTIKLLSVEFLSIPDETYMIFYETYSEKYQEWHSARRYLGQFNKNHKFAEFLVNKIDSMNLDQDGILELNLTHMYNEFMSLNKPSKKTEFLLNEEEKFFSIYMNWCMTEQKPEGYHDYAFVNKLTKTKVKFICEMLDIPYNDGWSVGNGTHLSIPKGE